MPGVTVFYKENIGKFFTVNLSFRRRALSILAESCRVLELFAFLEVEKASRHS
jgi:hypothetical protein